MLLSEPVSPSSRIVQRPGVGVEETAEGWALVDTDSGERVALSPAAAHLWNLLDGQRTVGDIAEEIGQPAIEVIELIRRLRANGLAGDAPANDASSDRTPKGA